MSDFIWIGDEKERVDGFRAKSQVIIFGDESNQYFAYGDVRNQMINSKGGNDTIIGAQEVIFNLFYGDSFAMADSKGGNDRLVGSDVAKYNGLIGDARNVLGSECGNDVVIGGANTTVNELLGDATSMGGTLASMSFGGNDIIFGGDEASENYLYGDAINVSNSFCGNDMLVAGDRAIFNSILGDGLRAGENTSGGNDRLVSGAGQDYMWGDFQFAEINTKFGRDTFVFKDNNGQDAIYDFRSGEDKIEISGIAGLADFSQLQMQITVQDGSSIIALGTDDTVTVIGVTNLQAQDFIFS